MVPPAGTQFQKETTGAFQSPDTGCFQRTVRLAFVGELRAREEFTENSVNLRIMGKSWEMLGVISGLFCASKGFPVAGLGSSL